MLKNLDPECWQDDGWFVGRLRDVPGLFSQGEILAELEANVRDENRLMKGEISGDESALSRISG